MLITRRFFPSLPSYQSEEPAVKRKADPRCVEIDARNELHFEDWVSNDKVSDYDGLSQRISDFLKEYSDWNTLTTDQCICIYRVDIANIPKIVVSSKIGRSLRVEAFKGESPVDINILKTVLGTDCVLQHFSQLSSLISQLNGI